MTDTSNEPPQQTPRHGLLIVSGGLVLVVLGFVSASIFPDLLARWRPETTTIADIQTRTNPIGTPSSGTIPEGESSSETVEITAEETTDIQPAVITTPDLPPELSEADIRLAERARLAFESPLSPAVRDIREIVKNEDTQVTEASNERVSPSAFESAGEPVISPGPAREPVTYRIARGTIIPTVLESKIDSALPGLIRARVSENVYDSLTGRHILIPRGARLIGKYAQAIEAGAQRLFVTWDDVRMPDGSPLDLDDFSSLGSDGAAGIRGRRSTGLFQAFGAAILLDLAGNATQILTGRNTRDQNDLSALLAAATGTATSRVADRYLGQLLGTGTRFRVNAGAIMNVLVETDIDLPVAEPWS